MRFIARGPSIPDELLLARDQGRVVFFCGAGVSQAKANLPGFFQLAAAVTCALGVQDDDPAMKIIDEAKQIGRRTGIDGLISADRVFGLLERDFLPRDIQEAVAKALMPKNSPDLSAHQTLLRLATTQEGLVRLVTTNFDRLFDSCCAELATFTPPKLPDPSRAMDFNGIVHLHGKIDSKGVAAEGDGFVLSSSEFGRAYLSDGWATSFVREILHEYSVVFVGYSADDPPIQYLLEALNRSSVPIKGVYAFQSGDESYASSRWLHKGVSAIPYDGASGHTALWDTLDAWAVRADNPDVWTRSVIERANSGPEILQPHQRGQVAHVVSTIEGLRKFSNGDNPPPGTWLCVFDSHRRYATPRRSDALVDPFDLYCLDSDLPPLKVDPERPSEKREVPANAWDAFELNMLDIVGLKSENTSSFRGRWSRQAPPLPTRLSQFGVWISKIARQPETVWWAARQFNIHPTIQEQIAWELEKAGIETPKPVHEAWSYLFDFWSKDHNYFSLDWYDLASSISVSGWNEITLRRFATSGRPYIHLEESFSSGSFPQFNEDYRLQDLIRLDVKYPDLPNDISVPDDWLRRTVVVLRRNLETALELENEIGGYGLINICPITADGRPDGVSYSRQHGLSAWILYFIRQVEQLMRVDLDFAKAEFQRWPTDDPTIFARLRIWALGQANLVAAEECKAIFDNLSNEVFWDNYHARDLLLSISARWNELEKEVRKQIEQRIIKGPDRWDTEEAEQFRERRAWASVNRLHWLNEQGCSLQLDLERVTKELREAAPKWKPEYAKNAARSLEGRSGWVRTETEHSILLGEPLSSTVAKAKELSGRQGSEFVEYNPFAGLSQQHPLRAFAALRLEAKKGKFPEWAWRAFLNPERRKCDRTRFTLFVGEQLSRYSNPALASIVRPVTSWFQKSAKILATEYPDTFSRLISKIIDILSLETAESASTIVRSNKEVDWILEAINSPTGALAEALFDDPQKDGLSAQKGFPKAWLEYVDKLLALPGDLRRHALVIFAHNLSWFFFVDPPWTKTNLLSVLSSNNHQDQEALWAGFLWSGTVHRREFFKTVKPHLLRLAKSASLERRGHTEVLTGILLFAWASTDESTGEKWLSDEELRDLILNSSNVRSRILWQAERWAREHKERWLPLLLDLLGKVWPRQITAKSGMISARLCDIAFSNEEYFPELAAAVLPLLTKIEHDRLMLPNLRRTHENIVKLYPRETLALLHAVLPDNVAAWPYDTNATIARIGETDNTLNKDERLIELKRKWDAR